MSCFGIYIPIMSRVHQNSEIGQAPPLPCTEKAIFLIVGKQRCSFLQILGAGFGLRASIWSNTKCSRGSSVVVTQAAEKSSLMHLTMITAANATSLQAQATARYEQYKA